MYSQYKLQYYILKKYLSMYMTNTRQKKVEARYWKKN